MGDRWLIIPGALLIWVMLAMALLLPSPEYDRDYKGAFIASAVAIIGAAVILGVIFGVGLWMGWTTI